MWALPGMRHPRGKTTDETLAPDHLPVESLSLFTFELTKAPEAALLHRENGGLLITCDCVQNWVDTEGCSLAAKAVTRAMGFLKPAQIGPPWRKYMTPEGGSLKSDFERMAELEFKHLVAGHGTLLRDEAQARLRDTITRVYGD